MSPIPFFATEALAEGYRTALQEALQDERLSEVEHRWLSHAKDPELHASMSVEMVLNAHPLPGAMLLITYSDTQRPWAYTYGPWAGLGIYDSRKAAEVALQQPMLEWTLPSSPLRYLQITQAVFDQWSQHQMLIQTHRLQQSALLLGELPTLPAVLAIALKEQFAPMLPDSDAVHLHRLLEVDSVGDQPVGTATLGEVALQVLSNQSTAVGVVRRYVDAAGDVLSSADANAWELAVGRAVKGLASTFADTLHDWWAAVPEGAEMDRTEAVTLILVDDFARAVLNARRDNVLDAEQAVWMHKVLLEQTVQIQRLFYKVEGLDAAIPHEGLVVLHDSKATDAPLFIYSATTGIRRFRDATALEQFFREASQQAQRPQGISTRHWPALQTSAERAVELAPVAGTLPGVVVQSLIALIVDNLGHALREPGAQPGSAIAKVDDALDIRRLFDRRLDAIDTSGRWPAALQRKDGQLTPVAKVTTDLSSRIRQIQALTRRNEQLRALQPSIAECIEGLLAPDLAMASEGLLGPADVRLVYDGTAHSLVDFFLKRLTGYGIGNVIYGVGVVDAKGKPLAWLDAQWLLTRIDAASANFAHDYKQRLASFEINRYRTAHGVIDIASETRQLYETLLRADLAQARDEKNIDTTLLDALTNVLDRNPSPSLAQHSLWLSFSSNHSRAEISNAIAISLTHAPLKGVLQWTPLAGLQPYPSLTWMRHAIDRTLTTAVDMREWATLLAPWAGRQLVRESVVAPATTQRAQLDLETAGGDLIFHLCESERTRRSQQAVEDLNLAVSCRFEPQLFQRYLTCREDPLTLAIRNSSEALYNARFNFTLPQWLTAASATDLRIYGALLDRCAQMATPTLSYLFGIPNPLVYARQKLQAALFADNPNYPDDPDQVIVTLTHYDVTPAGTGDIPSSVAAATLVVSKTLTEFSLTHFSEFVTAHMTIAVNQADKTVPQPRYLRELVARLDVATPYRHLLEQKLSEKDPDFPRRRQLFTLGMHPNLLTCAFQARLENILTNTGAHYFARVLASPDALAREPVDGVAVQFSRLQLQAGDLPPDTVDSLYVVAPADPLKGPVVLYTAYKDEHILTEFTDRADLLQRLYSDKRLETLVLDNLGVTARALYSHGGLVRPRILVGPEDNFTFEPDPGLTRLILEPIQGNLFHHLFEHNNQTLLNRAKLRTVTHAEAQWQAWRELLRLGFEQATVLAPRPLAALVNLWQAFDWVEASLEAAKKRSWGEALAEFTTALASLATLHDPHADTPLDRGPVNRPPKPTENATSDPLISAVTETTAQRLSREFEAHDVELNTLHIDPLTKLYSAPGSLKTYAPVQGKVYEVRSFAGQWHIIKDEQRGPAIRLRSDGQWELQMGLRGGNGDTIAALESARIEADLPRIFTMQASGIRQIAEFHYSHALQIQTAHALAVHLLTTTLSNLHAWREWQPLPERTRATLRATFGEEPSEPVLQRLRADCQTLLNELLSPNWSPKTSERYVSGYNVPGETTRVAITYRGDGKKRIFLTELFFRIVDDLRMNSLARDVDLLAHHQAITLLHELSHLALKTEDIVYVDAFVPSLDVLEQHTPSSLAFYNRIKDAWDNGLTATTPPEQLFKRRDAGGLRDLRSKDGSAKAAILRITSTSTLDEARRVFRDDGQKRAEVILSNADSLALLISRLGQNSALGVED